MTVIFEDLRILREYIVENNIPVVVNELNRKVYRLDNAQSIRDNAGVPDSEIAGIQGGVSPGFTGTLALTGQTTINNEANVQSISSSGDGSEVSPYIIDLREFNSGNHGIRFQDSSASYYVTVRNCYFLNHAQRCLWIDQPNIKIENCKFSNSTANAELVEWRSGDLHLNAIEFSGCNNFQAVSMSLSSQQTLTAKNILINENDTSWPSNSIVFNCDDNNALLNISHAEANIPASSGRFFVSLVDCAAGSYISNCKSPRGWSSFISDDADTSNTKENITINYLDISDTREEIIFIRNIDGLNLSESNLSHETTGAGSRVVFFQGLSSDSSVRPLNINAYNLKLTKKTGTQIATNEVLESWYGENVIFRDNWITECTEDGYEHVYSLGNCQILNSVADNCAGQVADFFGTAEITGSTISIITDTSAKPLNNDVCSGLWGDCADYALVLSGMNGVIFQDIYVDNTAGTRPLIQIEDRALIGGGDLVTVRNVQGSGAFSLPDNRANDVVRIVGGANINVEFSDTLEGSITCVDVESNTESMTVSDLSLDIG